MAGAKDGFRQSPSPRTVIPLNGLNQLPSGIPEVGATNVKQRLRTNSQQHAFSYWPEVRDEALDFLKEHLGAEGVLPKNERKTNSDSLSHAKRNNSLGGFLHGTGFV